MKWKSETALLSIKDLGSTEISGKVSIRMQIGSPNRAADKFRRIRRATIKEGDENG
ncbi:hypothetical protein RGR602_PC02241 (plasmid) [Rhizobium gallicum bv. gallicum R602sp]|uniref:Uncharacterized protein n=1 Tax=Rhizobium gallicum bv. gallicum R602sp TaxID=1041138 RepID=A0A0B4XHM8_9HYPH|nr:hypothetical protein RGR602_PC02241 [Rhizobium gallicum bv. gallicum R602sp]